MAVQGVGSRASVDCDLGYVLDQARAIAEDEITHSAEGRNVNPVMRWVSVSLGLHGTQGSA